MHFLLVEIRVAYMLTTLKLVARENETIAEARAWMKWEQDDSICKGHIYNAMVDSLFDIYDECCLVLNRTPLFILVKHLAVLLSNILVCFSVFWCCRSLR
jgi:hypothetical protein